MREEKFQQMKDIIKDICGVDIRYAKGRKQEYVRPRAAFCVVATYWHNFILEDVAEYVGYKDHTSVIHHRDNHAGRYRSDDEYASLYDELFSRVRVNTPDLDVEHVITMIKSL